MARSKRTDKLGFENLTRVEWQARLLQGEIGAAQARLTPFKEHYEALSELQDTIVQVLNVLNGRPRDWRELRR
jgi:hypothetical protein